MLHLDVPDVAGAARRAAVDLAPRDDAAADTGADLDAEEVPHRSGHARVPLPQRHEVHVVVDQDGAAQLLAERLADGEAVPAGHDRRRHGDALGEADRTRHADAGAVEALGHSRGPELGRHGQDLFEDGDRPFPHVHGLVEMAQDLQLGVGDGHVDRGGADVDAQEAQPRREPDVVGAASAARGGESVGHHEPGLQQAVYLHGQLGAGEIDQVSQLGAGVGAAVAQQPEQSGLVRVRGSSRHPSHAALPSRLRLGNPVGTGR